MNNISIRKMRVFLAAVEEGNFTRASVRENISQPAATIIINEIEETIGCQLFCRRGSVREARVNDAGGQVTDTFARIVASYESEITSIFEIAKGKASSRRVLLQRGFSDSLSGNWMLAVSKAFAPSQIVFEALERGKIVEAVRGREAVLGVVDGVSEDERCEHLQVGTYNMVLASMSSQPDTAMPIMESWGDLPGDSIIFEDLNPQLSRKLRRQISTASVDENSMLRISGAVPLAQMMRQTGRAAIVPDILVPFLNRFQPCSAKRLPGPNMQSSFGIIAPWGNLTRNKLLSAIQGSCFDA